MFRLTYEINGQPRTVDLADGTQIIGRGRTCDIVIPNKSVSGQHLRIDVKGDTINFRDLLSRNGTTVNGVKSEAGSLKPGDSIKLGKIIMRLETNGPAPAGNSPFAADVEPPMSLELQDDPIDGVGEETPVEQNFLPAPIPGQTAQPAVQVIKPAEPSLPVLSGVAGGDRRKILYAVGGFAAVVLIAILLIPTPKKTKKKPTKRFSYWSTLRQGVNAFKRADYPAAIAAWRKAEAGRKRYLPKSSNMSAITLARIAAPFACSGKKPPEVNWDDKIQEIRDLVESGDLRYKEDNDFAAGALMEACMREQAAQKVRKKADQYFAAGEFETAREQYARIPRASIYHTGVDRLLNLCISEQVRMLRKRAFALYGAGDLQGAIDEMQKIRLSQRTEADNRNIAKWRNDLEVKGLMRRFKQMVNSGNPQNWARAPDLYEQLKRHQGHPAVIDLGGLKEKLDKNLFVLSVQNTYKQWNTDKLIIAAKNPLATDQRVQPVINKAMTIMKHFADAKKAIKNENDLEGIEKAISHWIAIRKLEGDPAHPANMKAQQLQGEWPPERRGQICKERASRAFRKKDYRKAREYWEKAKDAYGIDVTEEIKMIKKFGNRLFNQGNRERIQKNYGEAKMLYKQALDCYLPTEPEYQKIIKKMAFYHLDD